LVKRFLAPDEIENVFFKQIQLWLSDSCNDSRVERIQFAGILLIKFSVTFTTS